MLSDAEPAASSVNASVIHEQEDTDMFLGQSSPHEETAVITMMIDDGNDCDVYSYGGDYDVYNQRDSRFIVGEQDAEDDLDDNATDNNYTDRDEDEEGKDDDQDVDPLFAPVMVEEYVDLWDKQPHLCTDEPIQYTEYGCTPLSKEEKKTFELYSWV